MKPVRLLTDFNPQKILHFAGRRYSNDEITFQANVTTTRLLLTALQEARLKDCKMVLPGTAAEYGNLQQNITEDRLPQPLTWYGLVKFMQTQLGLYAARTGQHVVVARIFNICGAYTPEALAMGMFAKQIVDI